LIIEDYGARPGVSAYRGESAGPWLGRQVSPASDWALQQVGGFVMPEIVAETACPH